MKNTSKAIKLAGWLFLASTTPALAAGSISCFSRSVNIGVTLQDRTALIEVNSVSAEFGCGVARTGSTIVYDCLPVAGTPNGIPETHLSLRADGNALFWLGKNKAQVANLTCRAI